MTEEEKQLLLQDICGRLRYEVMCFAPDYEYGDIGKLWCIEPFEDLDPKITVQYPKGNTITKFCSEVKPYLRSLSSMTEEEKKELSKKYVWNIWSGQIQIRYHSYGCWDDETECPTEEYIILFDWLNEHHFDYRGLIENGLALEAPEGMYVL